MDFLPSYNLFNPIPEPTAEQLKQAGMAMAKENADARMNNWSKTALGYLKEYAAFTRYFMCEELRKWASKAKEFEVPEGASNRAWGSVIKEAEKLGIISFHALKQVENRKAHKATATVWKSNI